MSLLFTICMILICSTNAWEHWNPNRVEEPRAEADVAYADEDSNSKTSQIALQNEIYDEIENDKNLETELSETDPRMIKKRQPPQPAKPKPDGRPCQLAIKDCKQFEKCEGELGNRVCVPLKMPMAPKRTPASAYQGSSVTLGADCTSSPDEINNVQIANLAVADKKLKLGSAAAQPENFVQGVCNWKITRLECVPNRPKAADLIPTTKAPPPPGLDGNTDDDDKDKELVKQKGKCKCLLAMGERAVWVPNSYTNSRGTQFGRCYIPANLGPNSKCGHDIVIPSGYIETGKRVYKNVGAPSSFCTPGSTCRTGYNYVGLRCSCNKTHIWIPKSGTCRPNADAGQNTNQASVLLLLLPLIAFLEIWRYIFGAITTS